MSDSTSAPLNEKRALTRVLSYALVRARMWGWEKSVDPDQLADLMDAVHNIPRLLHDWTPHDRELVLAALGDYEGKWADKGGPALRSIFDDELRAGG